MHSDARCKPREVDDKKKPIIKLSNIYIESAHALDIDKYCFLELKYSVFANVLKMNSNVVFQIL